MQQVDAEEAAADVEEEKPEPTLESDVRPPLELSNASSRPPLPENILELAAPNQDLATAYLRPEDNCYWYMHASPVETTRLPLRTIEGNPICVKRAE